MPCCVLRAFRLGIAALNKMEMLPWDVWGAIPRPNEPFSDSQLAFFDRLAVFTRSALCCYRTMLTLLTSLTLRYRKRSSAVR
jgi:hypothetical protein